MIVSFTHVFAIAVAVLLTATVLALAGLFQARKALRLARKTSVTAEIVTLQIAGMEEQLSQSRRQIEGLLAERDRERAAPARPSLREAVALSRHGASTEELISTCRIGQSEARLIQMLYGASRAKAA